jgi:hypothetical protein
MRFIFETDKQLTPIAIVEQKLSDNIQHDDYNCNSIAFLCSDNIKNLKNPLLISSIIWKSFAITQKFFLNNCKVDLIVFNNKECDRLKLSDGEKASVIIHELGHIFNRNPQIDKIPSLQDCLDKGLNYNNMEQRTKEEKNKNELYADSYVLKNGFKNELESCLIKSLNDDTYTKMTDSLKMRLNFIKSNNINLKGERKKQGYTKRYNQ